MSEKAESYRGLFEAFPELHGDDVNLQKEVYAHFGSMFSRFALLGLGPIDLVGRA